MSPNEKSNTKRSSRRRRPGARTRHALAYREGLQYDIKEGLSIALYPEIDPFRQTNQPPLQCSLEQISHVWKAWESKEEATTDLRRHQLEEEQQCLFGGDADDDVTLLLGMLGVVRFLWGDIDFRYTNS